MVISFDEIVKLPFSVKRYLSGKWLKNITRGVKIPPFLLEQPVLYCTIQNIVIKMKGKY